METPTINDLSISIATENGTGSASANNILFKAIFKMGIPCSSKNMFPSNIQGLPTWYQIRASGDGYMARKDVIDVIVMFNDVTAAKDIHRVRDGGVIIYDDSKPLSPTLKRDGVTYFGVPANTLIEKIVPASPLRIKQRNMVYVGALAALFGIDMETIKAVLQDTFGRKPAVIESNLVCIEAGYKHVEEKGYTQNIARLEAIPNGNKGKIITDGNTSCALGAIYGGASVIAWYPITPSSSLAEAVEHYMPRLRKSNGSAAYAIVQAEDEIAAVSMIVGAGWAGARAMTSTSGPGLSLMNEAIGLAYFAEIPCVFYIIQRGGPSTGLPTRTQQADIQLMYYASHGDTRHIILIPHTASRHPAHVLRLPRRHQAHHPDSARHEILLRSIAEKLRLRRPLPNAGFCDDGSRPRHEHVVVRSAGIEKRAVRPRQAPLRRRPGAVGEAGEEVPPLLRSGRRRDSLSNHSRQPQPQGFLLRARLGPRRRREIFRR